MPVPTVLPFAETVSTPPELPEGATIVLWEIGVALKAVPRQTDRHPECRNSAKRKVVGPAPAVRFQKTGPL